MARDNPTGHARAVPIDVPADHREFLRHTLNACCEGIYGDLVMASAAPLRDPEQSWREARAYERLLAAVDTGVIVPSRDVRNVFSDLAKIIDAGNEYERTVFEHRAMYRLLIQLDPAGGRR